MRRIWMLALAVLVMSGLISAQCGGPGSSSTSSSKDPAQAETKDTKDSKDKKKDKKKKDDKKSGDSLAKDVNVTFSKGVAEDLLAQIQNGLEGHIYRSMLKAFDDDKMDGYLNFEDQLDRYFQQYSSFRVRFRIANITVEGNRGILLVDADLEQVPNNSGTPQRKRAQLKFEVENGKKGWKIVYMNNQGFFS